MLNNVLGVLSPTTPLVTGSYESIQTFTVGSGGSASITFGSGGTIPSTYKHLQIRGIASLTSGSATNMAVRFNGDTAGNYSWHQLYGSGSGTPGAAGSPNENFIGNQFTDASFYSPFVLDILDYANTSKYKTTRCLGGADKNGSGYITYTSGNWRNTNAISSITIFDPYASTTFGQYSSFALYGIKG